MGSLRQAIVLLAPAILLFSGRPCLAQTPTESTIFSDSRGEFKLDAEGIDDLDGSDSEGKASPAGDRDLWPESDEADNQAALDRELAPTNREIRGKYRYIASASVFAVRPWQSGTITGGFLAGPKGQWALSAGRGTYTLEGESGPWHFVMSTQARCSDIAYEWYFSSALPLSLEVGAGIAFWEGSINPSGGDSSDPSRSRGALASGFSGQGYYGFGSINLTWFHQSGYFFKYRVIGLGDSGVMDLSTTNRGGEANSVIRKNLSLGQSWGFINLTVGKLL